MGAMRTDESEVVEILGLDDAACFMDQLRGKSLGNQDSLHNKVNTSNVLHVVHGWRYCSQATGMDVDDVYHIFQKKRIFR